MPTCNDITEHVIRYFCSGCNAILEATGVPVISEECPICGCGAAETLQRKPNSNKYHQAPVRLQTAYELSARLTFGIPEFDRLFSLAIGDRVCVVGSRRHANLILTRLWVRALMSRRHGGLAARKVLCIDAGNSINLYQCVSFARQYGMEIKTVLRSIIVSRVFTIYQLAGLVIRQLQSVIQRLDPKVIVVSDLLKMFIEEPQLRYREARYIIQEIMRAISRLPKDVLVVISLYGSQSKYDNLVLPTFTKRIELEEEHLEARLFNNRELLAEFSIANMDLRLVITR